MIADPQIERRTARILSAEFKLRTIADGRSVSAWRVRGMLRRVHLYSTQPSAWRQQLAEEGAEAF